MKKIKEEKRRLTNLRQKAVRDAWKSERQRVLNKRGTRLWTQAQQEEIIKNGQVKGFCGHHMKSVNLYPAYAGEEDNIQFLSQEEHIMGAHGGRGQNLTNGYYDPYTKKTQDFGEGLKKPRIYDLERKELARTIKKPEKKFTASQDQVKNLERSRKTYQDLENFRRSQKNIQEKTRSIKNQMKIER